MHKTTICFYSLLSLMVLSGKLNASTTHPVDTGDWFSGMRKHMRSMQEHMMQGMQEMQRSFDHMLNEMPAMQVKSPAKQLVTINTDDTTVTLSLSVPEASPEGMKAERNQDTITVNIPQENGVTIVRLSEHMMSVEHKQDIKKDDGSASHSQAYMERALPNTIDMAGDITIEHVKDNAMLTICIPRKHPKRVTEQLQIVQK